ncbi:MAG: lamin tail domain-containing protein [Promethearchaeota archaeon]
MVKSKFYLDPLMVLFIAYRQMVKRGFNPALGHTEEGHPHTIPSSLAPTQGYQNTLFNFTTFYIDVDNNPPAFIDLSINGTTYPMMKVNISDNDFKNGCFYQILMYLQPGIYNYSFQGGDWKYTTSSMESFTLLVNETNINGPILTNGSVTPISGYNNLTSFQFTVNYTDADNNAPEYVNVTINSSTYTMVKKFDNDYNYIDGCKYVLNLTLNNSGNYTYNYNASDGVFFTSSGPFFDIEVENIFKWNIFSLNDIRIGSVITHGEENPRTRYPDISSDLIKRGATISDILSVINSSILSNYDIIWIDEFGVGMSSSEIDAIIEWVQFGGRFILSGDNIDTTEAIAQRFNITYLGFDPSGITNSINLSNITLGIDEINFPFGVRTLDISMQPSAFPCVELNGEPVVASMEYGLGRFVIIADENIFMNHSLSDNQLLINNTFGWLGSVNSEYEPSLLNASVSPITGNQSMLFNFSISFSDQDNNYPRFVKIFINGTSFYMTKQNPGDYDFTDGCIYTYSSYLSPGTYNYSFECSDGIFMNSTITYVGLIVNSSNDYSPRLENFQVSPESGTNSTLFNFTTWYYDDDNNLPVDVNITINSSTYVMNEVDPSDFTVIDGKLYSFSTILDYGNYEFQIECYDGSYTNSTGWKPFPEVNPFLEGINRTLFYDDFENGLSKWESITGLWHLTDVNSTWSDPFHSPTNAMWFGIESTGNYDMGFQENGNLTSSAMDLSYFDQAYLEIFHWRTGEYSYDHSRIYISTDNVNWDLLYSNSSEISPWEKLVFNISDYCGNPSVQIRFYFTSNSQNNNYRGWLIDDVKIYSNSSKPFNQLQNPANNSELFSGMINFSWSSIDLKAGPVNYTLQVSNSSNFSTILYNFTSIPEIPNVTNTIELIDLPNGLYYWRVLPSFGPFQGNWSKYSIIDLSRNDFAPSLNSGAISPLTGNLSTQFNFSVIYMDNDNNFPEFIAVNINGTFYSMEKQNFLDSDYTDGCLYQSLVYLQPGEYEYSFECNDGIFTNATVTYTGLNVSISNLTPPILSESQVTPVSGYNNTTTFQFSVNYTDYDNNAPIFINITINATSYPLQKQDPFDGNYIDGCVYIFNTTLDAGDYEYYFNCSDGNFTASDGPYTNPLVEELLQWNEIDLSNLRIGIVLTHGEDDPSELFSGVITDLLDRGAILSNITSTIDLAILARFDLIWINERGTSLDTNELDAIEQWVYSGGRFITTGELLPISLISRFNISRTTLSQSYDGYTSEVFFHHLTTGVDHVYLTCSPFLTYLDTSSQPDALSCIELNGYTMATTMNIGAGKFVAIINRAILRRYYLPDNHIFINNTFGWLNNIINNFGPNLTQGNVTPISGNQSTFFNFTVTYSDDDDNSPHSMILYINGTPYVMTKQDPLDLNYIDGCIYEKSIYLQPGNYNYSFECNDGKFIDTTGTFTGLIVSGTNDNPPQLINATVVPLIGDNITTFNFSVWYFDADNNFPSEINLTINGSIYILNQANPFDLNAVDGLLFEFITNLDFGYYQFQFNCSDGTYSNSTSWYMGPEVNPFHKIPVGIVFNEMSTGTDDYIEMYNYGSDVNMTGWSIQIFNADAIYNTYYFPVNWTFQEHQVVVLNEYSGVDTISNLYAGWGIPWSSGSIAAGLFDDIGNCVDWFQTSEYLGSKPNDALWEQDVSLILNNNYAYRTGDIDTDRASDWSVDDLGTKWFLNPFQDGLGYSITLINPRNGSTEYIGNVNFTWTSLDLALLNANYTLQISDQVNFSNISYYLDDIQGSQATTSILISLNLSIGLYYWRVRPIYGDFYLNWTEPSIFNLIPKPPISNHPNNMIILENSSNNYITWRLETQYDIGVYRVLINGLEFQAWQSWPGNATNFNISINSSTPLGIWNYTVQYNDSMGVYGVPDSVFVIVNDMPSVSGGDMMNNSIILENQTGFFINWTFHDEWGTNGLWRVLINGTPYFNWTA